MKNFSVLVAASALMLGLFGTSCNDPQLLAPGGDDQIKGCTNQEAVNYKADAAVDDGSCVTVAEKQNSVMVKFTATWCGPCGDWGGPAFNDALSAHGSYTLGMSLQVSDNLTTTLNGPLVDEFSNKWNYSGTPNFAANESMVGTSVQNAINILSTKKDEMPRVGVGLRNTIGAGPNAGKINIDAYVKIFDNLTNETMHLAIYFLARNIVESQNTSSGYDNTYEHHHVLIGAATYGGAWGEEIITGNKAPGDVVHFSRAVSYDPSWALDELEIVAVVWKKDPTQPNSYLFENSTLNR